MQVKRIGRLLLAPMLFLSGSLTGLAQTSGSLRGIVEDDTGTAIAAAQVIIKGKAAEVSHTTGNEMGEFIFTGLMPGNYVLRAEATNFQPAEMKVTLGTGTPPLQHIRLKVASVSQEI